MATIRREKKNNIRRNSYQMKIYNIVLRKNNYKSFQNYLKFYWSCALNSSDAQIFIHFRMPRNVNNEEK